MSQIDDGGPAFPVPDVHHPSGQIQFGSNGMSLRDWIAGQAQISDELDSWHELCIALAGPCPNGCRATNPLEWFEWDNKWKAAVRYLRADAMLLARLTKPE